MPSSRELASFNRLLASSLERGMPLDAVLGVLAETSGSAGFRAAVRGLAQATRDGTPLPAALRQNPGAFPEDYAALVEAGLAAGRLPEILRHAAFHHELRDRLSRGYRRLAFYVGAGILASFLVLVILAFSGPGFAEFFRDMGLGPLPLSTRFVLLPSETLAGLGIFFLAPLLCLFPGAWAIRALIRRTGIGYHLPAWGRFQKSRDLAVFCAVLSWELDARRPLSKALALAAEALPNLRAKETAHAVRRRVEQGESLSSALFYERFFPRALAWAVSLAEERDDVSDVFGAFAEIHSEELRRSVDYVALLLFPLGVLFTANVAILAYTALMAPLLQALQSWSGGGGGGFGRLAFAAAVPVDVLFLSAVFAVYSTVTRREARLRLLADHLAARALLPVFVVINGGLVFFGCWLTFYPLVEMAETMMKEL